MCISAMLFGANDQALNERETLIGQSLQTEGIEHQTSHCLEEIGKPEHALLREGRRALIWSFNSGT